MNLLSWMRRFLAVVFFLKMCLSSGAAGAATLNELYILALANDPIFQAAGFVLQAGKQSQPEAFAALLPSLTTTGSGSRTFGRTRYTGTAEVSRAFDSDQWALQLTQPIFRMENILAYGEARASVEQAALQYAAAMQNLILRLARAYFDVLVAERHVLTAGAQVTALNEQLLAARRSYDAGVASITDVDDTQSRQALANAQQVAAVNDLNAALAALEAIIGVNVPPLDRLREAAVPPTPIPNDVAAWTNRAQAENPAVRAANAAVTIADYELQRSHAQRLPTLDMVATYGGNYSSGNITDPTDFGANVKDRQISLQVSVPIFEGGLLRARAAEARAKKSKAQADFNGAQRQAVLDARQSFAAVLSGVAQIRALETAVSAGRSAVKGNRVGYGLGIRINSDVLNAEQQLYSALQDLEKARYDALFDGLKLKAATGELSPDDLRGVKSLFETTPAAEAGDDASLRARP